MRRVSPEGPPGTEESNRSSRKRQAIFDAATEVFLRSGYLGANMDEIAELAAVSKQTVYKQFASKEALFVEIVTGMTDETGDLVLDDASPPDDSEDIAGYLVDYACRQLAAVLTPRVMQLRRLVIGEVGRFPELAKVLYEHGPMRAIAALAALFERLTDRGLLAIDDPMVAAEQFNWLIMSAPLNRTMLLGDEAIPADAELRRHAEGGVRVFLTAYGTQSSNA